MIRILTIMTSFCIAMSIVNMIISEKKAGWFVAIIGWSAALVLLIHIINKG